MRNHSHSKTSARSIAIVIVFAASVFSLTGCSKAVDAKNSPESGGPPLISAASVLEKSIIETQEFSGRLEAVDHVEIRPRVAGFITAINFKPGAEVKKGDVLVVIDPRPYQAEASRTEAAATSARAKADLAKTELIRAKKLVAEKAISQREVDEKISAFKEFDANAHAAKATHEAANLNLNFTKVHSPISGRVSKAEVTFGNLVDANIILTSVVSSNPIYGSFDVDEETYLRIGSFARKGEPVTVKMGLANETGFPHEGELDFIDNRLDPATGTIRIRAIFDNKRGLFTPGLFARLKLGGARYNAVLIDDRAVGTDQSKKFVMVLGPDNKVNYRSVTLGPMADGLRVVREGLKAGEVIVVNGLQKVHPGDVVTPQKVPMKSSAEHTQASSK